MSLKKTALYASNGPVLTRYEVDIDGYALTKRNGVTLPANVQYAWRHSSKPAFYVACSNRISKADYGSDQFLCAVKIDEVTGELSIHGKSVRLPHRPLHVTTDNPSRHVLVAFNKPANLMIFRVEADGTVGDPVPQRPDIEPGIFPHQVRVTPDNRLVILVTRGVPASEGGNMKDPGALKVFEYRDGVLGKEVSVTVGDGYRYGSRHLDFHPTGPWIYVSLELQNELYVHKRLGDEIVSQPLFTRKLFCYPSSPHGHQAAGTVHFHTSGRVAYCVNRGNGPEPFEGKQVVIKPDNTFAVFSVNPDTGEPTLIQHIDSGGICPRTFSLDPSGRMLVAANAETHWVKQTDHDPVRLVSANLAVFRVLEDGKLEFKRKYDVELRPKQKLFWVSMVPC